MVTVKRTKEYLAHKGVKGMKWGYNDGSRNGRRTAAELKDVKAKAEEMAKNSNAYDVSKDFEGDYDEANNMLKYLGVTLDLQSDDEAVVKTMQIYKDMAGSKDKYKTQYDWLRAFSNRLASIGYDMKAVTDMLDKNKDSLNKMETGTGTGNREKSNADWAENTTKKTKNSSSKKKSTDKETDEEDTTSTTKKKSSDKTETKATSTTTKSSSESTKKTTTRKTSAQVAEESKKKRASNSTKKSYSYRPKSSYSGTTTKKYPSRSKYTAHSDLNQNGDELYHHGILGQRWGVRRFQNADGSLTDAGRKRYGDYSHMSDEELKSAVNRKRLENRYKDLKVNKSSSVSNGVGQASDKASKLAKTKYGKNSDVTKTTNAVGDVAKDTAKIVDKVNDAKTKSQKDKIDLSNISDADLQKAINRMQMEQEMQRLDSSDVNRGKVITADTLQNIGLVASTAVDVVTLAILMKKVLKK